jgi:alpha-glucosidase
MRTGAAEFLDLDEPVLGLVRRSEARATLCLFNLGREPVTVELPGALADTGPSQGIAREGAGVTVGPFGFGWFDLVATGD